MAFRILTNKISLKLFVIYSVVFWTALAVFKILWCSPGNMTQDPGPSNHFPREETRGNPNRFDLPLKPNEGVFRSSKEIVSHQDTIEERMKTHRKVCQNKWTDQFGNYKWSIVMFDNDFKLSYCFVAKVGCTFWLRMFTFLTGEKRMKELGIKTPFDIDRSHLHTGVLWPTNWQLLRDIGKVAKSSTLRFFFTRNPFERLWSVYLDKYYLVDYWVTQPIADTQCGLNVTFQQFLEVAVTSSDHHLVPVVKACEPCAFKPNFIGKMETFAQDSKYLLKTAGYDYLMNDYNHNLFIETEIKSLITYNFKSMKYEIFTSGKCLSPKDLCERMWKVFQMNGLIKDSIQFPQDLADYSENSAINLFLETVRTHPVSKEESKMQRRTSITKAYSNIRWDTILKIQNRFKEDFEMFEYDLTPPNYEL